MLSRIGEPPLSLIAFSFLPGLTTSSTHRHTRMHIQRVFLTVLGMNSPCQVEIVHTKCRNCFAVETGQNCRCRHRRREMDVRPSDIEDKERKTSLHPKVRRAAASDILGPRIFDGWSPGSPAASSALVFSSLMMAVCCNLVVWKRESSGPSRLMGGENSICQVELASTLGGTLQFELISIECPMPHAISSC